jgi:hypothetical protein
VKTDKRLIKTVATGNSEKKWYVITDHLNGWVEHLCNFCMIMGWNTRIKCKNVWKSQPFDFNPLMTEVYFCYQNQNAKNIGNFMTLLKPHNIGTHLKGIKTCFQVVPLFLKSFHFGASYVTFWNFLKIPSVFKGLITILDLLWCRLTNVTLEWIRNNILFCCIQFRPSNSNYFRKQYCSDSSHEQIFFKYFS